MSGGEALLGVDDAAVRMNPEAAFGAYLVIFLSSTAPISQTTEDEKK